jgi:rSAM/selenodomain-associated transferase 2
MRISIVIPTLNEAKALGSALDCLDFQAGDAEVIVSDGGSTDATAAIATRQRARLVCGAKGRGQQLRRGAAIATGDAIVFLHADTRLAPGALDAVRTALAEPGVVGGNFRLIFSGPTDFAKWLTGFYAWIRRRGFYYGDSVIFVRREVYDVLGGIRPIALMEDFDFVRRMERFGRTRCIANPPAVTSSRRFTGRRRWRIVLQWVIIHVLYALGVSPATLARSYRSSKHGPSDPEQKPTRS